MKILFAALALPFPPTNGHRMRNRAMLQALVEEGHEVSLISFVEPSEMSRPAAEGEYLCRRVERVVLPFASNGGGAVSGNRLRALASPLPYGVWRHRSTAMRSAIQRSLEDERLDLIICDDIYNVANLPEVGAIPVLLNKHDITHVILRRYLTYERNPLKLAYGWLEYAKLRRWEAQACANAAGVLTCSDWDLQLLRTISPEARYAVVPNVVDVQGYVDVADDDGRTVVYVGALDWLPNQDAVGFFAGEILPTLRQLVPEVRFRVIGRSAPEELQRSLARLDGVELTGWVPDVRTEIAKAAVCVVPLRIGSGTRLKILEAAAQGKPIVSTGLGAEGLHFAHNQEIVLADRPEEFSSAVAALLRDPTRRRSLGQAARRCVVEKYSLPVLCRALRQALEHFAGKPVVDKA